MKMQMSLLAMGLIVAGTLTTSVAAAQEPSSAKSVWDGVYSHEQAARAKALYSKHCTACHGADLRTPSGPASGPPLVGSFFMNRWSGQSVAALAQFVHDVMPLGQGGLLSSQETIDLVALMLEANGFTAGAAALQPDDPNLGAILIEPSRKASAGAAAPENVSPPVDTPKAAPRIAFKPLTDAALASPDPADWPMWRRTYNSWGHSPLEQINRDNVRNLQLAWSFASAPGDRNEPSPLVVNGIMFITGPNGDVQALDGATGDMLWEYHRKLPEGVWMTSLRNVAVYEDAIYIATGDAHLIALDAQSGKVRWDTQVADYRKGYGYTSGPIVVKGKVVTGIGGCNGLHEEGCFITAHDARTGKEVWRTSTIARPGEPGGNTWGKVPASQRGGGDAWIPCSYDSTLDLIYCGVSQAKPWAAVSRGMTVKDAALYTSSTLALNPQTGKIVWYHQYVPGETLDMDENGVNVLIDRGPMRTLLEFGKHGILWKLNRASGQYLAHQELVGQNIFARIDPRTGAVTYDPSKIPVLGKEVFHCPSHANASWVPTAYDPAEGALFTVIARSCIKFTALEVDRVAGKGGEGGFRSMQPMPGVRNVGEISAVDLDAMKKKWTYEQRAPFVSGPLSTAGGLLFVGDLDRYFRAFDSQSGKILWQSRLPSAVGGVATSYSVGGRQYIAVPTGYSSISALLVELVPEIKTPPANNGVYVFRLPEEPVLASTGQRH